MSLYIYCLWQSIARVVIINSLDLKINGPCCDGFRILSDPINPGDVVKFD